jgi:hypothetical protein
MRRRKNRECVVEAHTRGQCTIEVHIEVQCIVSGIKQRRKQEKKADENEG